MGHTIQNLSLIDIDDFIFSKVPLRWLLIYCCINVVFYDPGVSIKKCVQIGQLRVLFYHIRIIISFLYVDIFELLVIFFTWKIWGQNIIVTEYRDTISLGLLNICYGKISEERLIIIRGSPGSVFDLLEVFQLLFKRVLDDILWLILDPSAIKYRSSISAWFPFSLEGCFIRIEWKQELVVVYFLWQKGHKFISNFVHLVFPRTRLCSSYRQSYDKD